VLGLLSRAVVKKMANAESDEHERNQREEGAENDKAIGGRHKLNSLTRPYIYHSIGIEANCQGLFPKRKPCKNKGLVVSDCFCRGIFFSLFCINLRYVPKLGRVPRS